MPFILTWKDLVGVKKSSKALIVVPLRMETALVVRRSFFFWVVRMEMLIGGFSSLSSRLSVRVVLIMLKFWVDWVAILYCVSAAG